MGAWTRVRDLDAGGGCVDGRVAFLFQIVKAGFNMRAAAPSDSDARTAGRRRRCVLD